MTTEEQIKAAFLEGYQAGLYTIQPNREQAWLESDARAKLESNTGEQS